MKQPRSLDEYAKQHGTRRGPKCSVCSLPTDVLKQVHDARVKRISNTVMANWLREIGHPEMNRQRLENHFQNKHNG